VPECTVRAAIAKKLSFQGEIIIVRAREVLKLAAKDPFAGVPSDQNVVRFVNVLAKRLPAPPSLPLVFPATGEWALKVTKIEGRFVLGIYRRQMKAIGYLGKMEKQLGIPATNRNWNTIEKVVQALQ